MAEEKAKVMRIVIVKKIGNQWIEVVPGYNDEQLKPRLLARVKERLSDTERFSKHWWTKGEIIKHVDSAFQSIVDELKEETVKLK